MPKKKTNLGYRCRHAVRMRRTRLRNQFDLMQMLKTEQTERDPARFKTATQYSRPSNSVSISQQKYCKTISVKREMDVTNISLQESIRELSQEINIKEEFNPHIEENLDVKTELEYTLESQEKTEPDDGDNIDNQYEETELQIKNELIISLEAEESQNSAEMHMKDEGETECILPSSPNYNTIKLEIGQDQASLVSFDYPNYEDSMDSSEAAALSHVEACLSDDINIKRENVYEEIQKDYPSIVKDESGLTVTETHLISNKFINTTSTITSTHDGIIESQTTKTLIMEIHPMTLENPSLKMGNPEEILPTSTDSYEMEEEQFQLNSITGNILTLEQEAYGLLKTKKTAPTGEVVCPKCPKLFAKHYHLKRHLKVHEQIENRANGVLKGLKTRLEKKKVKDEDDINLMTLVKNEKEGKESYYCTCGKSFRRRSRMETCLRSHTEYTDSSSYHCPTCEKKFKSKELLTFHRQRQHRKKFPCKFCPTDYHTQKALFKHLRIHQKVQLTEYKVIAEGNQELQCLLCEKTCSKLSELKSHVMEDHTEPYQCPHCPETFAKINEFAIHIKKTHPDDGDQSVLDVLEAFSKLVKAWKCENCGKQFHKADKLALHQVEEHTPDMKNEQHFQCGDCQRVFISKCGLNSHMRMHHRTESTEEPEPEEVGVLCLECRKVCPDMNALTSHMRLHSMDRKYPCKFCDFRFATPQKRKKHSEIHTGDMKYVCFICEYTCSSENRLKQHKMSIKHANMKEYLLTGKPLIEEEQSTSKKDKIKDELRKKEWGVKKRKKEKRERDDDIACDICGESFSTESEMLEHKQTHPFIEFPNDDKPSRIFFK